MHSLEPVYLIDTHCHLDFDVFANEIERVLEDARAAGVKSVINPGVDIASSKETVRMASNFSDYYAAVGVHPNEATSWNEESLDNLKQMANSKNVKAIGEIGLDYYRQKTPKEVQIKVLENQLSLAHKLGLPVIIHNREASQDLLAILSSWCSMMQSEGSSLSANPGVLHSFSADLDTAEQAIKYNFYIGVTGPVTFPNAVDLQRVIAELPLTKLLLETDSPFLAPQPRRGKRNEPAFLPFIAQKIAELRDITIEEVGKTTTANARRLFQIGERTLA